MSTRHVWNKYNVSVKTTETESDTLTTITISAKQSTNTIYYGDSYACSSSCTVIELYQLSLKTKPKYVKYNDVVYKLESISYRTNFTLTGFAVTSTTTESKGSTSYGQVYSTYPSAYPQNGRHGGYWYVYVGSEEVFEPKTFTAVGNVQRKLSAIPAKVGGVQRELESIPAMIDGVSREVFSRIASSSGIINFEINGFDYTAEAGMTWAEWVSTDYNIVTGIGYDYYINNADEVCINRTDVSDSIYIYDEDSGNYNAILGSEIIKDSGNYSTIV